MKSAAFETLSLNLLKTFCVFAEVGKVEETALKLGITQASVSLQLKKLEEETGQNLFKTVGRKKMMSSFARDLFQSIAPPLHELERRLKEVSKTQLPADQRVLRIGCRQDLIKRLTPMIHFPGQVILNGMTSTEALAALRNDDIDVAVVPDPQIKGDWFLKKLFIDQPVLIANPKILKGRNWGNVTTQLLKHSAVAYKKPAASLFEVVDKLGGKSSDLKIKLYCEDWLSIIDSVRSTPVWSVLPRAYKGELENLTTIEVPQRVLPVSSIYSVSGSQWRSIPMFKNL